MSTVASLLNVFESCQISKNGETKESIESKLTEVKDQDFNKFEELVETYVTNKRHLRKNCECERNDVGKSLATVIGDRQLKSGRTGLHHALGSPNEILREQFIDSLIEAYPEMLCTFNSESKEETPVMLAAWWHPEFLRQNKFPEPIAKAMLVCGSKGQSALTYSFKNSRIKQPGDDENQEDISLFIARVWCANKITEAQLIAALKETACPSSVVKELSSMLEDREVDFSLVLPHLLQRKDLTVHDLNVMLQNMADVSGSNTFFANIRSSAPKLSEIVGKSFDEHTNRSLFKHFYETYLMKESSRRNICHEGCTNDNLHLLSYLAESLPNHFTEMMLQYDENLLRPAAYSYSPLQLYDSLSKYTTAVWRDLNEMKGYNILYYIMSRQAPTMNKAEWELLFNSLEASLHNQCTNEGDTSLHVLLAGGDVWEKHVEKMVKFYKAKGLDIDVRNAREMTPYFSLCANLPLYEPDSCMGIVELLKKEQVEQQAVLKSPSGKKYGPHWLAKMSLKHHMLPVGDKNFDDVIKKIVKSGDEDEDEKYYKWLCQRDEKGGLGTYKVGILVGEYSKSAPPPETVYRLIPDNLVHYLLPRLKSCTIRRHPKTEKSWPKFHMEAVSDEVRRDELSVTITKPQASILATLKEQLGLTDLLLPDPKSVSQTSPLGSAPVKKTHIEVDSAFVDGIGKGSLRSVLADLRTLHEIGLIDLLEGDKTYVLNLALIEQASLNTISEPEDNEKMDEGRELAAALGMALPGPKATGKLLNWTNEERLYTVHVSPPSATALLLPSLADLLIYMLARPYFDKNVLSFEYNRTIELKSIDGHPGVIMVYGTDQQLTNYIRVALQLAIEHINKYWEGYSLDRKPVGLALGTHDQETTASTPMIPDPPLPDVSDRAFIAISQLPASLFMALLKEVAEHPFPDEDRREQALHTDIQSINTLRRYSHLVRRENSKTTVRALYHRYKEDSTSEMFLAGLISTLGIDKEHLSRLKDHCKRALWWTITLVIALAFAGVAIWLSIKYSVKLGFTGVGLVIPVFVISYYLELATRRGPDGKFRKMDGKEVLALFKGCK